MSMIQASFGSSAQTSPYLFLTPFVTGLFLPAA